MRQMTGRGYEVYPQRQHLFAAPLPRFRGDLIKPQHQELGKALVTAAHNGVAYHITWLGMTSA